MTVCDGEMLAIQGPTGQGKTTLLQLLGGLDRPTSGEVCFDGRDLATMSEIDLSDSRAKSFGFVFQKFNLIPTLTAQENVEVALVPQHVGHRDRRARANRALAEVGLGDRATTSRRSCRVANNNVSPSPGLSPTTRGCSRGRADRQPRRRDARRDHQRPRGTLARSWADARSRDARLCRGGPSGTGGAHPEGTPHDQGEPAGTPLTWTSLAPPPAAHEPQQCLIIQAKALRCR